MPQYSRREVQPPTRVEYFVSNPTDIDEIDKMTHAAYNERSSMAFVKVHATEEEIICSFEKPHDKSEDGWLSEEESNKGLRRKLVSVNKECYELRKTLHSIWLYVNWKDVTKRLETYQRELWLDAIEKNADKGQDTEGERARFRADMRWWADDHVPVDLNTHDEDG